MDRCAFVLPRGEFDLLLPFTSVDIDLFVSGCRFSLIHGTLPEVGICWCMALIVQLQCEVATVGNLLVQGDHDQGFVCSHA